MNAWLCQLRLMCDVSVWQRGSSSFSWKRPSLWRRGLKVSFSVDPFSCSSFSEKVAFPSSTSSIRDPFLSLLPVESQSNHGAQTQNQNDCGTWVRNINGGVFMSPNYPNTYPPNKECIYILEGKSVLLRSAAEVRVSAPLRPSLRLTLFLYNLAAVGFSAPWLPANQLDIFRMSHPEFLLLHTYFLLEDDEERLCAGIPGLPPPPPDILQAGWPDAQLLSVKQTELPKLTCEVWPPLKASLASLTDEICLMFCLNRQLLFLFFLSWKEQQWSFCWHVHTQLKGSSCGQMELLHHAWSCLFFLLLLFLFFRPSVCSLIVTECISNWLWAGFPFASRGVPSVCVAHTHLTGSADKQAACWSTNTKMSAPWVLLHERPLTSELLLFCFLLFCTSASVWFIHASAAPPPPFLAMPPPPHTHTDIRHYEKLQRWSADHTVFVWAHTL